MRKIILAATAVFLLFAASAQAHNVSATAVCGSVTINWSQFSATGNNNNGLNSPSWTVTFTPAGGGVPTTITETGTSSSPWAFPGANGSWSVTIPKGNGTVQISSSIATSQTRDGYGPGYGSTSIVLNSCALTPSLSTTASGAVPLGGQIHDTAHLGGTTANAGGTITFRLYGPNDSTCSGTYSTVGTVKPINGSDDYDSEPVTINTAGTWRWRAFYTGDANNLAVSTPCNDNNEAVTIGPNTPAISTTASQPSPAVIGSTITDTAHLTGLTSNATGTVTFKLYGPNDTTCSGTAIDGGSATVNGSQTNYDSQPVIAPAAGTWRWIASYTSGDANNQSVAGHCNDSNEGVTIGPNTPAISTSATQPSPASIGANLQDTAHLTGLTSNATGTVTFKLYGPNDSTCSGTAVDGGSVAVNGAQVDYQSNKVPATAAGTWRWVASYTSGDANNQSVAGHCNDSNEGVTIGPNMPAISTTASQPSPASIGADLQDTAHLTGLTSNATGTVSFKLYGPNDSTCSGTAVDGGSVAVNGAQVDYQSNKVPATAAGTWRWVASYTSGDANNQSVAGHCNDSNEGVTINENQPAITTKATPGSTTVGTPITDTATLTGTTPHSTGTITWNLYGPNDTSNCTGTPIFKTVPPATVDGDGTYTTPESYTPTAAGTYQWIATYSGDTNNTSVSGACGDVTEQVVVASPSFTLTKQQTIAGSGQPFTSAPITVQVGQQIVYQMIVTNTGSVSLALTSFSDPKCDVGTLTGPVGTLDSSGNLPPGGHLTWNCSHIATTADSNANPPQYVNTATAVMHPPGQPDLPPQSATVVANIPHQGVLPSCTVSNNITIHGPTGGVTGVFDIRISSGGLKSASVYIDGKHYKTVTGGTGGKFVVHINPKKFGYGGHTITVKTTPTAENCNSVVKNLSFVRVKPAVIVPKFTG